MGLRPEDARARTDPLASRPLAEAVEAFRAAAHAMRKGAPVGSAMPKPHVAAWERALDAVDEYLSRPAAKTSALDTVRTRLQLETELDADMHTFGDVPGFLAERQMRTLQRLSVRLTQQTRPRKKVALERFLWPLEPVVVSSPYGHRVHPLEGDYRFHAGVDLAAEAAQPVRAVEAGTVVFSGWNSGHGKQIELQHDAQVATRYSHLMSLLVAPGTHVRKGDIIGLAGQTGKATGVHLHFELRKDGLAVDPELFLPDPYRLRRVVWR